MYTIDTKEFIQLTASEFNSLMRFRYSIFIQKLGWELQTISEESDLEVDEYDTNLACYVIARDRSGKVLGMARLISASHPTMLREKFGFLCEEPIAPTSDYWEMTRFAVQPSANKELSIRIFKAAVSLARSNGAKYVVGIINVSMHRYYRSRRIKHRFLGRSVNYQGDDLVAISIPTAQPIFNSSY